MTTSLRYYSATGGGTDSVFDVSWSNNPVSGDTVFVGMWGTGAPGATPPTVSDTMYPPNEYTLIASGYYLGTWAYLFMCPNVVGGGAFHNLVTFGGTVKTYIKACSWTPGLKPAVDRATWKFGNSDSPAASDILMNSGKVELEWAIMGFGSTSISAFSTPAGWTSLEKTAGIAAGQIAYRLTSAPEVPSVAWGPLSASDYWVALLATVSQVANTVPRVVAVLVNPHLAEVSTDGN